MVFSRRTLIGWLVAAMSGDLFWELLAQDQPPRTETPQHVSVGSIEGIVLDQAGKPVAGATVYSRLQLDVRRELSTTSDSAGNFTLEVPAGVAFLYAYKESDGYADPFYAFFKSGDRSVVKVEVEARQVTKGVTIVVVKGAYLKIDITDREGNRVGGQLTFTRDDLPERGIYKKGSTGDETIVVPPVPFRLTVDARGYVTWSSRLIALKPGESLNVGVRLRRSE
jgi:hypothetical protein